MKSIILSISLLLTQTIVYAQNQEVKIEISQKGKIITPVNKVYELANETFSFDVTAKNTEGFLIGITFDDDVYRSAIG